MPLTPPNAVDLRIDSYPLKPGQFYKEAMSFFSGQSLKARPLKAWHCLTPWFYRVSRLKWVVFLRTTIDLPDGVPGVVMGIHTFGDYPEKYHPHLHAIVTDGLFTERGTFYVMPKVDSKPLENIFRARVFTMLKEEEKITEELIDKLMNWNHSGFSVHKGEQIARNDEEGREKLAQYIIRNTFSMEKLTCNEETGTVIYHSKMTHGKDKKNFKVYTAEAFIAAITQHIPDKSFQMILLWLVLPINQGDLDLNKVFIDQMMNQ